MHPSACLHTHDGSWSKARAARQTQRTVRIGSGPSEGSGYLPGGSVQSDPPGCLQSQLLLHAWYCGVTGKGRQCRQRGEVRTEQLCSQRAGVTPGRGCRKPGWRRSGSPHWYPDPVVAAASARPTVTTAPNPPHNTNHQPPLLQEGLAGSGPQRWRTPWSASTKQLQGPATHRFRHDSRQGRTPTASARQRFCAGHKLSVIAIRRHSLCTWQCRGPPLSHANDHRWNMASALRRSSAG